MNQVLVAHDRDANIIPENIRKDIEIEGVVGTFEWIGGGNISYVVDKDMSVLYDSTGESVSCIWMCNTENYVVAIYHWATNWPFYILRVSRTWALVCKWHNQLSWWYIVSMYLDWDNLFINISNWQSITYNIATDTITIPWGWSTWTQITNTSITLWYFTYTWYVSQAYNNAYEHLITIGISS